MTDTNQNQYLRSAKRFRMYKFIALIAFVVFVMGGLVAFKDDITAENLKYLFKYINTSPHELEKSEYTINLSAPGNVQAGMFREDFAVLYGDSFSMYTFSDELLYTHPVYMSYPKMVTSEKGVLCYDVGGSSLMVFNSFSLLWELTFEYPIIHADINDNGYVSVVTSEQGVQAAVYVYDGYGNRTYKWSTSDKFVVCASLSDDRIPYIAVNCVKSQNGDYFGEIITLKLGESSIFDSKNIGNVLPVQSNCADDGTYDILTESSVVVYNRNTGEVNSYPFGRDTLRMYRSCGPYLVLAINENKIGNDASIVILNKACKEEYNISIKGRLMDMEMDENKIYVLTMGTLHILESERREYKNIAVSDNFKKVFISNTGQVVLLSEDRAIAVYVE